MKEPDSRQYDIHKMNLPNTTASQDYLPKNVISIPNWPDQSLYVTMEGLLKSGAKACSLEIE